MQQFINLYVEGRVLEALRLIHTSPDSCLEDYPYPLLANYTDAMIWGSFANVFWTNRYLKEFLGKSFLEFQQVLDRDVERLVFFQDSGLEPPFFPFSYPIRTPSPCVDALFIFQESIQMKQYIYNNPLPENYYLLDEYPEEQFKRFPTLWEDLLLPNSADATLMQLMERAFRTSTVYDLQTLYKYGLELRDLWRAKRWGESRIYTQILNRDFERRYDLHKEPYASIALNDSLEAIESRALSRLRPLKRRVAREGKKRLAHIVSKICDENNSAPSRVLRTFIDHHDRESFDLFVYSHEQYIPHAVDYPCLEYQARPTEEAAKKTLEHFEKLGATVDIGLACGTFLDRGHILAEKLSQDGIDIGVFHQYPPINAITAALSDIPLKVYLDHGMRLPVFNSFDMLIVSHLKETMLDQAYWKQQGVIVADIPMLTDSFQQWESDPYPKSYFSVPDDAKCLATASNCLEERLSPKMCVLIADVLRKRPHVYYILMGPLRSDLLQKRFLDLGVFSQIRFIGNQKVPSQVLRSVDIYLNEFPVGGSFSVLDAMASGRPVVTLYSSEGPPQSRYAAIYVGNEWAVNGLDEYYELICRLLDDAEYFKSWEEHVRERYRERVHPKHYVRAVEEQLSRLDSFHELV